VGGETRPVVPRARVFLCSATYTECRRIRLETSDQYTVRDASKFIGHAICALVDVFRASFRYKRCTGRGSFLRVIPGRYLINVRKLLARA